jgi:arylformamidase
VKLIDISPTLDERTAVWPGDRPLRRETVCDMEHGDNYTLSHLHATVHLGAHADAPKHYRRGMPSIESRPLHLYYGPCEVVRVKLGRGERICPAHLAAPPRAPRVLFATGSFPDSTDFNPDFCALSAELIAWLHDEHGVHTVGIDTPSVDLYHDQELESHNALADRDMANLEGLVLGGVEEGVYTLVALPLKLAGSDASPVRAMLVADA